MIGGPDGRGDWGVCDPQEPRNRRMRSSVVFCAPDGRRLLIDSGPDVRAQLLGTRIASVDAVLYTHPHADHIAGLDELRQINRALGRPLQAFGTEATLREVEGRFDYAFRPWSGGEFYRPVIEPVVIDPGHVHTLAGFDLAIFQQSHGRTTSLGMRCGSLAYCTDVVALDDEALAALEGVETFVVDCFQRDEHSAHGWLEQVEAWRSRIGATRTVLTHMGTDMDWGWLVAHLPQGVEPAYDGMIIPFEG
ncbi:MBL fold metallo-hydrolase [Ameyamaea chiangmaiensis]|uniref:MBL fold metallo-hydrolase n=1 Tax=Ameyamaea chiangmaiensis TaxID=442969 RepID=A0A850P611_9PROT|nr:MBL fold metallo-hydrolase [Ameyamaea chiangmaiensis]MBS4073602.1 MBL fold metallo-hydrolase [Ameyamaea chiangmaiensis]NVN40057.1 MBL fold metallo-hydrolase [Ameyamaea chiangmaiensis]